MQWRRWLAVAGKLFFGIALVAGAAMFVLTILSGTLYGARTGCEECSSHIQVVILSILALLLGLLSALVGIVLTIASRYLLSRPGP